MPPPPSPEPVPPPPSPEPPPPQIRAVPPVSPVSPVPRYVEAGERALRLLSPVLARSPQGFASMLGALADLMQPPAFVQLEAHSFRLMTMASSRLPCTAG